VRHARSWREGAVWRRTALVRPWSEDNKRNCPITQRLEWIRVLLVTALVLAVQGDDSIDSMLKYISKTCKYNVLPSSLSSRAFTKHTGEVHVSDVFGVPSSVKQHIMQINFPSQSLFTLQARPPRHPCNSVRRCIPSGRGREDISSRLRRK